MKKKDDFGRVLNEQLKDREGAAFYINAAFKSGNIKHFLGCLKDVIQSNGGIAYIAENAKISRESLYRTLAGKRNPPMGHIEKILNVLGLHLTVVVRP